jgi:hypothetical protein
MFGKDMVPHIILSKSILLTKNSSTKIVHDYLNKQLDQVILDFCLTNLDNGNKFQLNFKYKRVSIDLSKIPD